LASRYRIQRRRNRRQGQRFGASSIYPASSAIYELSESAEGLDSIEYDLLESPSYTVEEIAEALDRIEYDLTANDTATVSEDAEALDRIFYDLATMVSYTVRESAEGLDRALGGAQVPHGPLMAILVHIYDYFADGDDWAFSAGTLENSHNHAGIILRHGSNQREIPVPAGPPRLGQMELEFDDLPAPVTGVAYFRSRFGQRTPRGKRVDLKIGPLPGSEALYQTPASGIITHCTFPPGKMRLQVNDVRYLKLQKPIPGLVNSTNFPNLPPGVKDGFLQYVFGNVSSVGFGEQGAIKCFHLDTVNHRYALARHPIKDATIYKKAEGETEFTEVTSGYTLTGFPLTSGGKTYNISYVQFSEDQNNAEIRADVEGLNILDAWGLFPPRMDSEVLTNVIDFFIALYQLEFPEEPIEKFDIASFARVRQQFEDLYGDLGGAAYAITESMTPEVAITQMFASFLIHWFPNRRDQTKVVMTTADVPEDASIIGDFHGMLRESELVELATDTRNRFNYKFGKLYSDGQWGAADIYNNEADQALITDIDGQPLIEQEDVELWAVRDPDVADLVIREWSLWRDQDAHRIRFKVDLPKFLSKCDLAEDVLLTHYGGLAQGGWTRERFIPVKMRDDFDAMQIEIEAVRRPAQVLPPQQVLAVGQWRKNALTAFNYMTATKKLYHVMVDTSNYRKLVAYVTNSQGEQEAVDTSAFPSQPTEIDSFKAIVADNKIHVWYQIRTSGRVGYSVFDQASETWETLDDEVLASNSNGDIGVDGCIRENGEPVAVFMGDREASTGCVIGFGIYAGMSIASAGDYRRAYVSRLVSGSWTSPVMVGSPDTLVSTVFPYPGIDYNGAVHINIGRAMAGLEDRVRFVYSVEEPADTASTNELYSQVLREDNTLTVAAKIQYTGGLGANPECAFGDPCVFTHDGTTYMAVPVGLLFDPKLYIFEDNTTGAPLHTLSLIGSGIETQPDSLAGGTLNPPMSVDWFLGKLHVVMGTRVGGGDDFATYKTIEPPFATVEPDATSRADQVGPTWPGHTYARHSVCFGTRNGRDYMFKLTSGSFGIPSTSYQSIFEQIDLATDVPGDNGYTLAEWIADNE
jgi:hypothetical protein